MTLNAGARVSALSRNSLKNTPLHAAAAGGHADIALLLIERGADVTIPDAGGHTPLHIAAENGLVDVVKALLARGADPLAVDGEDKTPLSRAAAKNRNEVVDVINTTS
jgi:ankyrin repeat protein